MKKVILNSNGKPYLDNGKPIMVDIPENSGGSSSGAIPTVTLTVSNQLCTYIAYAVPSNQPYIDMVDGGDGDMTIQTYAGSLVCLMKSTDDEYDDMSMAVADYYDFFPDIFGYDPYNQMHWMLIQAPLSGSGVISNG